jgi:hypothetical protein
MEALVSSPQTNKQTNNTNRRHPRHHAVKHVLTTTATNISGTTQRSEAATLLLITSHPNINSLSVCYRKRLAHIKDFLETYKAVLSEADVEDTSLELDGSVNPQLKYFMQLVSTSLEAACSTTQSKPPGKNAKSINLSFSLLYIPLANDC